MGIKFYRGGGEREWREERGGRIGRERRTSIHLLELRGGGGG